MPHLPPRSPRRERRDDHNVSPNASDNEDEQPYQNQHGSRRKGPSGPLLSPTRARGDYGPDQPSPLSPSAQHCAMDGQDGQLMASVRSSSKQPSLFEASGQEVDYAQNGIHSPATPSSPAPTKLTFTGAAAGSRKLMPGQTLAIPANLTAPTMPPQELGPSSPTGMGPLSTPVSPIAAIIDQDAEKFRVYMNKLNSPNRKAVPGPLAPGTDAQEHAAALGQAVAMENIQAQIEIQNQFMSQTQGPGGREASQAHALDQWSGANPSMDTLVNPDSSYTQEDNWTEHPTSQASLQVDRRDRRRESSLPPADAYPKTGARTTSHHRDDEEAARDYPMPQPPKRYDSQPLLDNSSSTVRSGSPTPSGNSSVTSALPNAQQLHASSRSGPTVHQQALHMFGDNLEFVSVLVVGSNIKTNDKGKELLTFLVSLGQEVQGTEGATSHKEDDELWRIEKQYIDFMNLDSRLRVTQSRNIINNLPRLPDKSLFSTHAPSKVDARKIALEQYLQQLTSLRIKDTRDLCEFLSTNVVERGQRKEGQEAGWREGYLTKRGKNFGGWKTRFFVLKGPVLDYFDTKDGHHLGSIALTYAQIGRQQSQDKQDMGEGRENATDPNSYRHAFLILEPKKGQTVADAKRNPNNVIRHVLCAETDEERDEWVDALLRYVGKEPVEQLETNEKEKPGRRMPEIQKVAATPIKELASVKGNEKLLLNQEAYERQQRSVPPSPSSQQFHPHVRGGAVPQSPTTAGTSPDDRLTQERSSAEGQYGSNSRTHYNQYGEQEQQQTPWAQPLAQQQHYQQQQYPSQQQMQHQQHQHPFQNQYHTQQQHQPQPEQHLQQQHYQSQQPPQQLPRNQSSHSLNQYQEEGPHKVSQEALAQPPPALSPAEVAEKKQRSRMTFHWPKKAAKEDAPLQEITSAPSGATQDSSRLRTFLGKGNSGNSASINSSTAHLPAQGSQQGSYNNTAPSRQVFGVPLEQAVEQAQVQPGYELPAVVYRCIEYLNAHKAKLEEGIYRLNGSSAVIKNLKDRFNQEGDVPLLASDEYYDIHAVAGLLKLFLRDLPSSVLTRELHKDFLQVIELANRADRVDELTRLVAVLPEANYTLLRALTAHLIEIVENADINKMTARNVGIVFSPTLGIPAGVFALLMSDFDQIFHTHDGRIMPLENSDAQQASMADTNALSEGIPMH
ncbi:hypothetical protein EDD11_002641 [Mortierella claussenii]|nr:hypothetical protein EDD11_002641 [Mortierella claussenii]